MTTRIKSYPFEVLIAGPTPSVALADQIRSLDWRQRRAKKKGAVSADELAEIRAKLRALLSWQRIPNFAAHSGIPVVHLPLANISDVAARIVA